MSDLKQAKVSDFFEKIAVKYLTEVDANPIKSNQHEIGGLKKAGFFNTLGDPGSGTINFPCRMVYLNDNKDSPMIAEGIVSWYDARRASPTRSPEYRLYYPSTEVSEQMKAGDLMVLAQDKKHTLHIIITPKDSEFESQLKYIFSAENPDEQIREAGKFDLELLTPFLFLFEDLGIDISRSYSSETIDLDKIIQDDFSGGFPSSKIFSAKARELTTDVSFQDSPDMALLRWFEMEEALFRKIEEKQVLEKLTQGFDNNVDDFISYSLSIQNRRKSRAGLALENHLEFIFSELKFKFEKGSNTNCTENNKKPDFMFPSFSKYHDNSYDESLLRILAAKKTCKDRWRQVLSEAVKVKNKHLITLECSITENQTNEMKASQLQLVVPSLLHKSYKKQQQEWLMSLSDFIQEIQTIQ